MVSSSNESEAAARIDAPRFLCVHKEAERKQDKAAMAREQQRFRSGKPQYGYRLTSKKV